MDGHLTTWRTHRLLATIYGLGLVALAGYLHFRPDALAPHTVFVAYSLLPVLFVLHALAARGSRLRQPWARLFSLVMGALLLLALPVGTVFGFFLLRGGWQPWPEARAHAGAPRGGWPQDAANDRRRGGDRRGGMR